MSDEFSRDLIIPGAKFDVAGEKFRPVEKEKLFILENLSKARIESASNYGYGFLEGRTEGIPYRYRSYSVIRRTVFSRKICLWVAS